MRLLTNMMFWQSSVWTEHVDSIYPEHGKNLPPEHSVWKQARMLFSKRKDYDIILTMGVRESMAYGFLCLLTGQSSKQVMTEVFIDDQAGGLAWKLKNRLYSILARRSIGILTNSSTEQKTMAERYRMNTSKLHYVPLNSTLANEPLSEQDDAFILAAGRTLRDYKTFVDAVSNIDYDVVIICGHDDALSRDLPDNIKVLREVSFEEYVNYIKRCSLLAVPLLETERATGQVVMLDAMAVGKPVVVTDSPGTMDYIRDGENGLLVPAGDKQQLENAIRKLVDSPKLRKIIGSNARTDVQEHYTFDKHARLKLDTIAAMHRVA